MESRARVEEQLMQRRVGLDLVLGLALIALSGAGPAVAADQIVGKWNTVDEKSGKVVSEVELYDQGGRILARSRA
jgi:hypothetical protein